MARRKLETNGAAETASKEMNFMAAMLDFFGRRQDQTPTQFMQEVRTLNRAECIAGLEANGYHIVNKE